MTVADWNGTHVAPGEACDVHLDVSETYSGITVRIPVHVRRGTDEGPVVFVTAAVHGDEVNGTGAIRELIHDPAFDVVRGAVICVPVVNPLAFDRHSRYMPDRRDLNRCFPGSASGSLASRLAHAVFSEIVGRSDYGIDLHTAAVRRTNYPTVRGDLSDEAVQGLAEAFGTEIILNRAGPEKAFRREATEAGCPTIVLEAGEVWKVEPAITKVARRGILNVLRSLGVVDGTLTAPSHRVVLDKTTWMRADHGGFVQFHIRPGDVVEEGAPISTTTSLLGREKGSLHAPFDGIVIGMTTLPSVSPGTPICHLARLPDDLSVSDLQTLRDRETGIDEQVMDDLATNVRVVED